MWNSRSGRAQAHSFDFLGDSLLRNNSIEFTTPPSSPPHSGKTTKKFAQKSIQNKKWNDYYIISNLNIEAKCEEIMNESRGLN